MFPYNLHSVPILTHISYLRARFPHIRDLLRALRRDCKSGTTPHADCCSFTHRQWVRWVLYMSKGLKYRVFPPCMTLRLLSRLVDVACTRWPLIGMEGSTDLDNIHKTLVEIFVQFGLLLTQKQIFLYSNRSLLKCWMKLYSNLSNL
jgi:hypothetical protein